MATIGEVTAHIEGFVRQLQAEGVLNEQFTQLLELDEDGNFVREVIQLFFEDSGAKIDRIGQLLTGPAPDYNELDQLVHQFKGSSASLGAQHIAQLCIKLREHCQQQDNASCMAVQQSIRQAYANLKAKLEQFLQMDDHRKQLVAAGAV